MIVGDPLAGPVVVEPDRSRRGIGPWPWILLVLVLIGGALAAYLLSRPTQQVGVPLVVGQKQNVALAKVTNVGLTPIAINETNTAPAGTVVQQVPDAGAKVSKGSSVRLLVSSGPGNAPVPTVIGMRAAAAKRAIIDQGLKVGSTQTKYSSTIPVGEATGTDPPAGTSEPIGYPVTLFTSLGPAPVTVPDVTGDTVSAAKTTLTGLGLKVATTQQISSTQTPGTVISQSPTVSAPAHSTINLVIAEAPPMVSVPSVTGDTPSAATKALKGAGFAVSQKTTKVTSKSQNKTVVSQDPGGGSQAKQGATVTIVVGQYTAPTKTTTTPTTTTPTTTTPTTTTG
jgi:serine/threonine-protein kinase